MATHTDKSLAAHHPLDATQLLPGLHQTQGQALWPLCSGKSHDLGSTSSSAGVKPWAGVQYQCSLSGPSLRMEHNTRASCQDLPYEWVTIPMQADRTFSMNGIQYQSKLSGPSLWTGHNTHASCQNLLYEWDTIPVQAVRTFSMSRGTIPMQAVRTFLQCFLLGQLPALPWILPGLEPKLWG